MKKTRRMPPTLHPEWAGGRLRLLASFGRIHGSRQSSAAPEARGKHVRIRECCDRQGLTYHASDVASLEEAGRTNGLLLRSSSLNFYSGMCLWS